MVTKSILQEKNNITQMDFWNKDILPVVRRYISSFPNRIQKHLSLYTDRNHEFEADYHTW